MLIWSKRIPSVEGYYWVRGFGDQWMVQVRKDDKGHFYVLDWQLMKHPLANIPANHTYAQVEWQPVADSRD